MTATSPNLLIRADASVRIGTGHVMRCLALAQGWRRTGGKVLFACAEITPALEARLAAEGFPVRRLSLKAGTMEDAEHTIEIGQSLFSSVLRRPFSVLSPPSSASWIVVDGYHFDADYQRRVKESGLRLLVLDDYGHASHYAADLVLNQNLHARVDLYTSREPYTRLLLGTRYVLLREQFLAYRDWQRLIPTVARKILVTLGGTDPDNVTGKVVDTLSDLDVEARIIAGSANPHLQQLRSKISSSFPRAMAQRPNTGTLRRNELIVDTTEMPAYMAWADMAVSAGGSTSWELAFMGLPSLVLVLDDNQKDVARRLDEEGVSVNLGPCTTLSIEQITTTMQSLLDDEAQREAMSQRGRRLVDCDGVARVLTQLRATDIRLRRAGPQDCRRIWEWANDPAVRASAFSSEPIPWESHQAWFAAKLAAPSTAMFIAMDGAGTPYGQIRFEWNEQTEAEIDVNVSAVARQTGGGSALIRAGVNEMLKTTGVQVFYALVKKDNPASVRAFEKAGFRRMEFVRVRGQETWRLTLTSNND